MNANQALALLSEHPRIMYIDLAVVTPSPFIANLSSFPQAASLPFPHLVIITARYLKINC
ncbi:Bgt-50701 [Blumeria graminis f. sp. tritici]|uniref:Bgt-50701 n=1 Tax=Blumeria graminis f. sp. tritici TaxID=62690 RepID=A0A9X9L8S9_BLUGR|nr:Bgt-50701 [Blumeria graminis f. sp. tritici]